MNIPSEEFGTFRIRDDEVLERRIRSIRAMHKILRNMGKFLELSTGVYKPKRSIPQNSRLWWLHGLVAKRLNDVLFEEFTRTQNPVLLVAMREPWDKKRVHEKLYKPQFLDGKSSTERTKMETVDDHSEYEAWMVQEIGVQFPEQEYA